MFNTYCNNVHFIINESVCNQLSNAILLFSIGLTVFLIVTSFICWKRDICRNSDICELLDVIFAVSFVIRITEVLDQMGVKCNFSVAMFRFGGCLIQFVVTSFSAFIPILSILNAIIYRELFYHYCQSTFYSYGMKYENVRAYFIDQIVFPFLKKKSKTSTKTAVNDTQTRIVSLKFALLKEISEHNTMPFLKSVRMTIANDEEESETIEISFESFGAELQQLMKNQKEYIIANMFDDDKIELIENMIENPLRNVDTNLMDCKNAFPVGKLAHLKHFVQSMIKAVKLAYKSNTILTILGMFYVMTRLFMIVFLFYLCVDQTIGLIMDYKRYGSGINILLFLYAILLIIWIVYGLVYVLPNYHYLVDISNYITDLEINCEVRKRIIKTAMECHYELISLLPFHYFLLNIFHSDIVQIILEFLGVAPFLSNLTAPLLQAQAPTKYVTTC